MGQRHMPLGYKMVNGTVQIHEEHAAVVKRIFTDYIAGKSMQTIAKELTDTRIYNANKKPNWSHTSVGKILQNKKYIGDTFYPQLVEKHIFEQAQERRKKTAKRFNRTKSKASRCHQSVFKDIIRCGDCNEVYRKYVEHAGKPSEKIKWKCKQYIKENKVYCRNHFFEEGELEQILIQATNQLLKQKRLIQKVTKHEPPKISLELRNVEKRIKELEQDGDYANPKLPELIMKRAQLFYAGATIDDHARNAEILKEALAGKSKLMIFDETLFSAIIKQITVYKGNKIDVEFINGTIIEIPIEKPTEEIKETPESQGKDGKHGSSKKDGGDHTTTNEI
ncbi:MAG: recombinase [Firmicutes bacterium HGW-Firmicutes-2]|nr:MAG: recombinase [Firmicutes bacterium HGW-Firmicutes-2]